MTQTPSNAEVDPVAKLTCSGTVEIFPFEGCEGVYELLMFQVTKSYKGMVK